MGTSTLWQAGHAGLKYGIPEASMRVSGMHLAYPRSYTAARNIVSYSVVEFRRIASAAWRPQECD